MLAHSTSEHSCMHTTSPHALVGDAAAEDGKRKAAVAALLVARCVGPYWVAVMVTVMLTC